MNNLTSQMRCQRVLITLSHDPYYARYLKGTRVKVRSSRGQDFWYPPGVMTVTERLAARDIDAAFCPKELILAEALYLEPYRQANRH